MKRITITLLSTIICLSIFSQNRITPQKSIRNHAVKRNKIPIYDNPTIPYSEKNALYIEHDIGLTYYDLQSTASMQKRFHVFDDGTMGGVFTMGSDYPQFPNRGTSYNYFDGESWGPIPEERLESDRTGWPAYVPFGENGEIIVSHISNGDGHGLLLLKRENKGDGEWEEWNFTGPEGHEDVYWPRIATGGLNNSIIHLLSVSSPVENGGNIYQGLNGALLYSRSADGGETWEEENIIIEGIDSSYYLGFKADTYDLRAEGENVAILIGDYLTGLTLLKSTDGGYNWEKTVIWEHPYPKWDPENGVPTDTFYCADGAHSLDFDEDEIVHVVFGINRSRGNGVSSSWFPAVGGVGYWNESRPTFSNNVNALCPYADCSYTELIEDYSLIGWTQDIDNNGELDINWDNIALYYLGLSSMPQIIYDNDHNDLVVVYSSVTETFDNSVSNFRHLWIRASSNNGENWGLETDLTSDPSHQFDECIFPSLATASENGNMWPIYFLTYLLDSEPGLAFYNEHPYVTNYIRYMKTDIGVGIHEGEESLINMKVSQNKPNPFTDKSTINISLKKASNLSFEVIGLTGKKVYGTNMGFLQQGTHKIVIDGSKLGTGMYFYTINSDKGSISRKMIIE